jgi:molybdopterin molybdotransferase
MITVSEAKKIISELQPVLRTVQLELEEALGFVLGEDILSPINMPPFDQSAMDGYALKFGTSLTYNLKGEVPAGSSYHPNMKAGEAVRIFTGAAVPDDADAVIMQEKTQQKDEKVIIEAQPKERGNIRPKGEQIEKGTLALEKGAVLTPAAIGFLAGLGVQTVKVVEKPNIGILVTGNELVKAGNDLERGQIYESNGIMLKSVINDNGFEVQSVLHVEDDYNKTLQRLKEQMASNDFLIISGGISVGDYDYVGQALLELGVQQLFYKVRQKPGKPMFLGKMGNCTIFALPGNPAAALSCFYEHVLVALKQAMGDKSFSLKKLFLPLEETYHKKGDRAHFLKGKLTDKGVKFLQKQSSAMLFSFAYADALIYIPEDKMETIAGELVEVHLI